MALDRQMVFNDVWTKLFEQGGRSMLPDGRMCAYRGKDGLKCAVGHLIPDDAYRSNIEGTSAYYDEVSGLIDRKYGTVSDIPDDPDFLRELQNIHDGLPDVPPEEWRKEFEKQMTDFAKDYGLSTVGLPRA